MKSAVIAAALALSLLSAPASADVLVYQHAKDERVTINTEEKCEANEAIDTGIINLALLAGVSPDSWKGGKLYYRGEVHPVCWTQVDQQSVFILTGLGGGGNVPLSKFRKEEAI